MLNLPVYSVSARAFFAAVPQNSYSSGDARERCKAPMEQLVRRFGLIDKKVVSLGSALAHEEYWLAAAGCSLTLVDLDEDGSIQPFLDSLSEATPSDSLRYVIGDAEKFIDSQLQNFDCLYLSSLTPDELRRNEIQRGRSAKVRRLMNRLAGRELFPTWPRKTPPLHRMVEAAALRLIKPGGFFILQSYCGGVDVLRNPHWSGLLQKQLRWAGVELLEIYYWKENPAISMIIGYKGNPADLNLKDASPILDFHGRSTFPHTVARLSF